MRTEILSKHKEKRKKEKRQQRLDTARRVHAFEATSPRNHGAVVEDLSPVIGGREESPQKGRILQQDIDEAVQRRLENKLLMEEYNKAKSEEERAAAAIKIQSASRARNARKEAKTREQERKALEAAARKAALDARVADMAVEASSGSRDQKP